MVLEETMALVVFARVVEAGSFTAAARALGVSKSVVSERVSALEARLGVRLLHRSTRRLSLTTDGSEVYERCARMVSAADEALALASAAGNEPRGLLRVTAPTLLGQAYLGAPAAAFAQAHPAVRLELVLTDSAVDVVGERFDVAIRGSARPPVGDLRAQLLVRDRKVLCASPEYLARRGTPLSPLDLGRHDCLRFSPLDVRAEWTFNTPEGPVLPSVSGSLVANDTAVLREAAREGLGLAVLPGYALGDDLVEGRLVQVLPQFPLNDIGLYALYAPGRRAPAKVRAFVDLLARHFRSQPWGLRAGG
jgi:DNA-binding transcriptional LysR family regulator